MEPVKGFEPPTYSLRMSRSSVELHRQLTSLLTIHAKNPNFGVKNGGPDFQKNIISDLMRNFALLKCQAP